MPGKPDLGLIAVEAISEVLTEVTRERNELRAEVERHKRENVGLLADLDESDAENERLRQQHANDMHTIDVGSRANAALEIEIEQLRAENRGLSETIAEWQEIHGTFAPNPEVERLKTDPYKAGYIDGHHDAHARRDESYRDCPRCSFRPKE